jgi:glycosyltransferase involved in cell wall biosynthesis
VAVPLITILIDTYNYGHFIGEAIESVLAQDFPAEQMEILVVDDGSTDDTAERVRKYGSRVQYFRKPNGGQASAFNFGFARAKGDVIALLDADDHWVPGKLRRVVEKFESDPDVGMVYHAFWTREQGRELREGGYCGQSGFVPANRKSLLLFDLHPTSTLAFRRNVLERVLPVPEELVIQADAHLSACAIFVARVCYIREPLTVYRIHGSNLWNAGESEEPQDRVRRRMNTTRSVGKGVRAWLQNNGFDINRSDLKAFFLLWKLSSDGDEFKLTPPGRLRFVRHLLEYPRHYGLRMTWRHKLVSYLNAFGALFTGYKHYHRLDESRVRIKQAVLGRGRAAKTEKTKLGEGPAPLRNDTRS